LDIADIGNRGSRIPRSHQQIRQFPGLARAEFGVDAVQFRYLQVPDDVSHEVNPIAEPAESVTTVRRERLFTNCVRSKTILASPPI
jgi:hypothetical protein